MPSRRGDDAVRITTAARSAAADTAARQRRYLLSMGVRTLCVIGAVVIGPGWLRWVLVAGAVVIPQLAVVAANAVDRRSEAHELLGPNPVGRQLPGAPDQDRLS
ncbi:DUF3099 domain-containing protein [Nocardioides sp.]|uniref:DUF3099 domain-containing protein n=1 Tax=Nocardioides sp. TaxID=35761 RepID=UPI0035287901